MQQRSHRCGGSLWHHHRPLPPPHRPDADARQDRQHGSVHPDGAQLPRQALEGIQGPGRGGGVDSRRVGGRFGCRGISGRARCPARTPAWPLHVDEDLVPAGSQEFADVAHGLPLHLRHGGQRAQRLRAGLEAPALRDARLRPLRGGGAGGEGGAQQAQQGQEIGRAVDVV